MENNQIIKIYGTAYKEMTKQLLETCSLANRIPSKNARIGIKPNLVSPSTADYGATTHPEIIAGIIEYLQENGFQNIKMMEGSWVGDRTGDAIVLCGYDRLSEKYNVPFIDAQKEKPVEKDCAGMKLHICECASEVDFMINVPVLKGHCQTKITCALKNMKGLIPNTEKRKFHAMGLHAPIAHLSQGIHQDFIVVDHICGDLDFEDGGNPVVRNCIMASCDPVLTDAYVCSLLHYDISEVPYIKMAEALGSGSASLEQLEIISLGDTELAEEHLPKATKVVEVQDAVQEVESCSACYAYLIPALDRLKEEGYLEKQRDKICIGQGFRGKTGKIGIGRCTAGFDHSLKGCPPTEDAIYEFLKNVWK